MSNDHYFSSSPETQLKLRTINVRIAGKEYELTTSNSIFSPERIDAGTQVLLATTPQPPAERNVLDLGCGWGPIALTLAIESPGATVWAVDVNERALDLVRANAAAVGVKNVRAVTPDAVPEDVTFATIWSNPPIRIGKEALHAMLEKWMPRLEQGADAWLVVQRNLGSDSLHRWMDSAFEASLVTTKEEISKGYRVLKAHRL
jgi:16S rRNA (guanine1207-N2)-methyltransferase